MNKVAETGSLVFRQKDSIPGAEQGNEDLAGFLSNSQYNKCRWNPHLLVYTPTLCISCCISCPHCAFNISACHSLKQNPLMDGNNDSRTSGHQSFIYKMPVLHILITFLLTTAFVLLDQTQSLRPPRNLNIFFAIWLSLSLLSTGTLTLLVSS